MKMSNNTYRLRTLVMVLTALMLLPPPAWGRSEHYNLSPRARIRMQLKRELEQIDKLRGKYRGYPYFQLDVF